MTSRTLFRSLFSVFMLSVIAVLLQVSSSKALLQRQGRNKTASSSCTPTFQIAQRLKTEHLPVTVATGDFNVDGKEDFVVANSGSNTLSIFLNDGKGNFTSPQTYNVGPNPRAIAVGDLNSDKRPDLVVANYDSNSIRV